MSDLSDFASPKGADSELQDFLLAEKQKAQFHAQASKLSNFLKQNLALLLLDIFCIK